MLAIYADQRTGGRICVYIAAVVVGDEDSVDSLPKQSFEKTRFASGGWDVFRGFSYTVTQWPVHI